MRRLFSLVLVLMILLIALGSGVGSAKAFQPPPPSSTPAPRVVVTSPAFKGLSEGQNVSAEMSAQSNMYTINCVATEKAESVLCTAPKKFAGESVKLFVTVDGQTLIFWVTLPEFKKVNYPA